MSPWTLVPLTNVVDTVYVAEVRIGTPPQAFAVAVDTGSDLLWVASASCRSNDSVSGECPQDHKFDMNRSSTASPVGKNAPISYGDNTTCDGPLIKDTIRLGDRNITAQPVMVATNYSSPVDQEVAGRRFSLTEGILGLMPRSFSGSTTVLTSLFQQASGMQEEFTLVLAGMGSQSSLVLGQPDKWDGLAKEKFRYATNEFIGGAGGVFRGWQTTVRAVGVGKPASAATHKVDWLHGTGGIPALVDSGCTDLLLQESTFDILRSGIETAIGAKCSTTGTDRKALLCPCDSTLEKWPYLSVSIVQATNRDLKMTSEFTVCLAPSEYVTTQGCTTPPCTCRVHVSNAGKIFVMANYGGASEAMVLGMPLFRGYAMNYDVGGSRIGFARSGVSQEDPGLVCPDPRGSMFSFSQWAMLVIGGAAVTYLTVRTVYRRTCGTAISKWREYRQKQAEERRALQLDSDRRDHRERFLNTLETTELTNLTSR